MKTLRQKCWPNFLAAQPWEQQAVEAALRKPAGVCVAVRMMTDACRPCAAAQGLMLMSGNIKGANKLYALIVKGL